jgi:alcohol dehydrogenase class IV
MTAGVTFDFFVPVDVRFGRGRRMEIGDALRARGARSALVVTDPGLASTQAVADIRASLENAGLSAAVFTDVEANPRVDQVDAGVAEARRIDASAVVGVGGGSSMDVAKAIGVLCTNAGPISRYDGGAPVPEPGRPVVAIPTTAGTGSEVTPFANFSEKNRHYKFAVGHRYFFPAIAIVDPEATVSMPAPVTAATGIDALAHAVESYVARTAHPASEVLALRAIELIGANLERAHKRGEDMEAREAVLLGSTLAGMAFVSTRLGVLHALAMPLGGLTDLPHGLILGILFAAGVRFNEPAASERYRRVADALGHPDGDAAAAIEALRDRVGIPGRFDAGVLSQDSVQEVAVEASKSLNSRSNPRPWTPDALAQVLGQVA